MRGRDSGEHVLYGYKGSGSAMSKSAAIRGELGRRHPGSGLLPAEPVAPVFAHRWAAQA